MVFIFDLIKYNSNPLNEYDQGQSICVTHAFCVTHVLTKGADDGIY